MTFGSLFSGIGGFDLGLERAGLSCKWQVELDPYCRRILRKHWPDVPKHRDIHSFPGSGDVSVDLVAGGFPCQDVSKAKQNAEGLDGDRSGLWYEFARIIDAVRPRYVLIENVPGLYRNGLGTVLANLASLGFDAEWDCIPAYPFGSPQQRHRLFIFAYASGQRSQGPVVCGAAARDSLELRRDDSGVGPVRVLRGLPVHDPREARARMRVSGDRALVCGPIRAGTAWAAESPVCRVAHGVPHRVDRLRAIGNAVVPQVAEYIGRMILEFESEVLTPSNPVL